MSMPDFSWQTITIVVTAVIIAFDAGFIFGAAWAMRGQT